MGYYSKTKKLNSKYRYSEITKSQLTEKKYKPNLNIPQLITD